MKCIRILFSTLLLCLLSSVAIGQIISTGALVANWNFTINSDVNHESVEQYFHEDYIPAYEKHLKGIKVFLLKHNRGDNEGGYTVLVVWKSIEDRNKWWPENGEQSEEAKEALSKIKPIEDKGKSLITWVSFTGWEVL